MHLDSKWGGARASSLFFVFEGRPFGLRLARAAAFCVFSVSVLGCGKEAEEKRREFAKISWSVRMLSGAENGKKAMNLEHLKGLPCKNFCEFRDGCALAYGQHLRGIEALRRAKLLVSESMDDDEEALELLEGAERDLREARERTLACHDRQATLKRRLAR